MWHVQALRRDGTMEYGNPLLPASPLASHMHAHRLTHHHARHLQKKSGPTPNHAAHLPFATRAPDNSITARFLCASKFGQAHSIGAALGGGVVASFLGGDSVSSLTNVGLGLSVPTSIGLGLPINDALRLSRRLPFQGVGSPAGMARTTLVSVLVNSLIGTNSSIVSLSGEVSLASFGGFATTSATAAQAASVIAVAKFG